jgi:hypothetical protein
MQKLHVMEEERNPSLPKTKPREILSLKVIRNHPYQSYKRQHHHLDKHSKTTRGCTPPTWGQIKCLVDMAKNAIKGWGQEETPTVLLLAVIAAGKCGRGPELSTLGFCASSTSASCSYPEQSTYISFY